MAEGKAIAKRAAPTAILKRIYSVRETRVMLDQDLAELYGVETRALVQAVKRNKDRFPDDFMFQVTADEMEDLKSQFVISSGQHGGRRSRPLVFTEQGVAMLSSVLKSKQAAVVNVEIMRAFVELRQIAGSSQELTERLDDLEGELKTRLGATEKDVAVILQLLSQVTVVKPRKRAAGFMPPGKKN
jgi:ORF6N domain